MVRFLVLTRYSFSILGPKQPPIQRKSEVKTPRNRPIGFLDAKVPRCLESRFTDGGHAGRALLPTNISVRGPSAARGISCNRPLITLLFPNSHATKAEGSKSLTRTEPFTGSLQSSFPQPADSHQNPNPSSRTTKCSASDTNEYQRSSWELKGGRRINLISLPFVSRLSRKCGGLDL
jgi:hypothetical protein